VGAIGSRGFRVRIDVVDGPDRSSSRLVVIPLHGSPMKRHERTVQIRTGHECPD
jgi:hypothetical protein